MINTRNNCNIYLKVSDVSATAVASFELRTLLCGAISSKKVTAVAEASLFLSKYYGCF